MRELLREALAALGVERLVCAVHDRSLPSLPGEDHGCGAPASRGAEDFLDFLGENGFTGVQLGPPGHVALENLSPYDGTAMSRSTLQLAAAPLIEGHHGAPLLPSLFLAPPPHRGPPERCEYERAFAWQQTALDALHERWDATVAAGGPAARSLQDRLAAFRARSAWWLDGDALHRALSRRRGTPDSSQWPDQDMARLFDDPAARPPAALLQLYDVEIERYAREQLIAHEQHDAFLQKARSRGLGLYGDLQVGLSHAERWRWAPLMLRGFWMGAPPSRTNPQGQPWGYPVLHPGLYGDRERPGPALSFLRRRLDKMFGEYDGVRIDHPHGLVCPWVYRGSAGDPYAAVQAGARLFSAGPGADPELVAFDIARPEQLALGQRSPWADDWVHGLDEAQVDRYAVAMDVLVDAARAAGASSSSLVCEVLSTMPAPLGRVIERHGLGRFRVTSKADVRRPDDVYLPTNAQPPDWIMVGTHDTRPLWLASQEWPDETAQARAAFAAGCLAPDGVGREALAAHFARSRWALAAAELAVLFTSRARNVMVFVSDLLGEAQVYNWPGEIRPDNWTLRVPPGYRDLYARRLQQGQAMDVPGALALALAALPAEARLPRAPLIRALAARARAPLPDLEARLLAR